MAEGQSTVAYRDVPGFPGYRVGDDGSVWSLWETYHPKGPGMKGKNFSRMGSTWRPLKSGMTTSGRPGVVLSREGKKHSIRVCRLVLLAFVGPCPDGMEACHFPDRDPANNRIDNLRWDTPKANYEDSVRHGTAKGCRS